MVCVKYLWFQAGGGDCNPQNKAFVVNEDTVDFTTNLLIENDFTNSSSIDDNQVISVTVGQNGVFLCSGDLNFTQREGSYLVATETITNDQITKLQNALSEKLENDFQQASEEIQGFLASLPSGQENLTSVKNKLQAQITSNVRIDNITNIINSTHANQLQDLVINGVLSGQNCTFNQEIRAKLLSSALMSSIVNTDVFNKAELDTINSIMQHLVSKSEGIFAGLEALLGIFVAIIVLVLIGLAVYFLFFRKGGGGGAQKSLTTIIKSSKVPTSGLPKKTE